LNPEQRNIPGTGGWEPLQAPPDLNDEGFLFGTSGYYFEDWVGSFYPRGLNVGDRLAFYANYFDFVEINSTFYRPQPRAWFENLALRVKEMRYAVKVHRDISHTRSWDAQTGKQLMANHLEAVEPLLNTGRLYSLLIQLEDRLEYTSDRLRYLEKTASFAVENGADIHIEFRHKSWHDFDILHALKSAGIGVCNTEIPKFDHVFPLKSYSTSDKGYLRYSGLNHSAWYPSVTRRTRSEQTAARNARYDYRYTTDELKERMLGQLALKQKTGTVAVAYNNHYSASAVINAIENMNLIEALLRAEESP
jgi:uncharacterized protein YecE (DUF72 family)